jgi:hypothetical protein
LTVADRDLGAAAAHELARALHPGAPARVGVLTNGQAGRNSLRVFVPRLDPSRDGFPIACHEETSRPEQVVAALLRLLVEQGVNVLAINGGDGTLHVALNALWDILDRAEQQVGEPLPSPVLAPLCGGTMNVVSRAVLGGGGSAKVQFRRLRERCASRQLAEVESRPTQVLAARWIGDSAAAERPSILGFVFGSALVANALELYTLFGEGYGGLARLLGHASLGVVLDTPMWRQYGHLLDPPREPAWLDETCFAPYSAVVASTVALTAAGGALQTLSVAPGPGFAAKVLLETHKARLLAQLPWLLRDWQHRAVVTRQHTRRLSVQGRVTLDGEIFDAGDCAVEVTCATRPARMARL